MTSNPSSITALIICVTSIYTFFLLWGLLQERITTTAYNLPISPLHPTSQSRQEYFKSPLFLNTVQAFFSTSVAAIYLLFRQATSNDTATSKDAGKTLMQIWGLSALTSKGASQIQKPNSKSTSSNPTSFSPLLSKYLSISLFQSLSSQLGLLSLSHGISYPTLILGKSCKLIPVLLMNLLLYRRKFPPHKYLVVFLVTLGISLFMLFSPSSSSKKGGGSSSLIGLLLLFSNLMLDGATNSTQDQVFTTHHILGSQMMLIMNLLSFALLSFSLVLPIPYIPLINPNPLMGNELGKALEFIKRHPEIVRDVLAYALAGALGQISIFETLERFGSLTLVSITVTRKLFTMLLSLFVYNHQLSPLQWIGVVTVFLGIGVEARESRKAKLKSKTVSKENSKKPSISTSNGKFQSENGEQKVNGNGIENGKGGKIE